MMLPNMIGQSIRQAANPGVAGAAGAAFAKSGLALDQLTAAPALSPQQLVKQVTESAGWKLEESEAAWLITIPINALRKQQMRVQFTDDGNGHAILGLSTVCGAYQEKSASVLLQYNSQLIHGAFAVENTASGPHVVLRTNLIADATDALSLTRVLTSLAWQADQVEERLSTNDTF